MTERSADDHWDLASSVGATATMVAASRALASRAADPLIDDPFAEALVRAVGLPYFVKLLDGENPSGDPEHDPQQSANHIATRTRFYDDVFLGATRGGVTQAVILASGLDTRPYRLPWPAGTTVFEIDLPAVLDFKASVLAPIARPAATHHAVAIDLRQDWPAALRDVGFDPVLPTVWSAEGLLYYLPDAGALLDQINALERGGQLAGVRLHPGHVVVQRADRDERGTLAADGRNINDLMYHQDRRHTPQHLADWQIDSQTVIELYERYGLAYPEREVFAAFADTTYITARR
jgi:methyltransferase (TIGR00027 family)